MSNLKQFTTPTLNLIHSRWIELVGYTHTDWGTKGSLVLQTDTNFIKFHHFQNVNNFSLTVTLDGTNPTASNTTTALQFYLHKIHESGSTDERSPLVGANDLPLLKVTGGSTIKFAQSNTSFQDTSSSTTLCLLEQYSY